MPTQFTCLSGFGLKKVQTGKKENPAISGVFFLQCQVTNLTNNTYKPMKKMQK